MKTIHLPGVERPVSQLCLGTAYLGHREDDETSFAIMDAYYEAGGRFLNTAHEYGNGHSERVIGKWIKERGNRDEITLTSKCGEDHSKPGSVAMHAEELFEDIDETLSRSGLDYVDFYLLHLDDPTVPVGEIMDALYEIRRQGKILYYGSSNWSVERQDEAAAWADAHGYPRFVVNEIEMNLAHKNRPNHGYTTKWLDGEYIAYHLKTGMAVGAYSPICNGLLTKFVRDGDVSAWKPWQIASYENEYNYEAARRVKTLSDETGLTPTQLQLAWVLSQPYGLTCFPILGARTVEQLKDSLGGVGFELTQDMIEYLRPKED